MEERFIYLVKKQLTATTTPLEEEELELLLTGNDELRHLYTILFSARVINTKEDLLETEQAYASHSVKMQLKDLSDNEEVVSLTPVISKKFRPGWFTIAALIAGGLFIGCLVYLNMPNRAAHKQSQKNEVATRKGSKTKVILPDSTVVWLNADSRLIYPENFGDEKREVKLDGEAFFEVTKDSKRPFIIHTKTIDVKVLGTVFNVRSYAEESTTETSLLRGEVEVTIHQSNKKIILSPNQKLTVANYQEAGERQDVSVQKVAHEKQITEQPLLTLNNIHFNENDSLNTATSWVDNTLYFDNEELEKMTSEIERWYNVEIIINNQRLRSVHFTATFRNESLSQVMEALGISYSFKYKIEEGKVTIY